ncbi:MAG: ACT domain-containing protein [Pyramidobacter sp.]|nr:ACT domain-containing protein [Pyramidobacter sp.]
MIIKPLDYELSVCKVADVSQLDLSQGFFFIGRTDEELSLVCETSRVPPCTTARDDGWKAFRIQGVLDFSLIGILAKISALLAENGVGIFAVSTYNTDYILVKEPQFETALSVLARSGYEIAR